MKFRLLLFLILPFTGYCQNTIGLPDILNYGKAEYNAGLQNWDIKQDKNGIIYIANNEGLLSFDGSYWNLYPLPNKTIVRSIEISTDNKIYAGGQDEFGYFAPGSNGKLQFTSLVTLIPIKERSFGDVWDISSVNNSIFFRTAYKIYKLTNGSVSVYNALSEWSFMGICNNQLYAHDFKNGLLLFQNGVWSPLTIKNELPTTDPVTGIISLKKDSILVTTLKHGLFILSTKGISKMISPNTDLFENERIYAAISIDSQWIALATSNRGLFVIDKQGNIIQSFSEREGLQNNNILSVFRDNQGNLWLGQDNGIDFIAYNSAIKHISPNFQDGSGYTAIIYRKNLYIGTSNGLFSVSLQDVNDLSFSKGNFSAVDNTKGQAWSLAEINNQLLLGHHEGAFLIENLHAKPIEANAGFWNFTPMSSTFPTSKIVAGNYKGLRFFEYNNGQFISSAEVPGFNESSRFVAIDKEDNIWVSHPYHGVFKLSKKNDGFYTTTYNHKNGLPSNLNNHIYKIKNEVVVATEKGIYQYSPQKNSFEPFPFYQKLLNNQSIRYLKEDESGNIWFIHEKTIGVIDFSGKEPTLIYLPELNKKMLSGFECIYPLNNQNIFLGGEKGFFHINYEKYKKTIPALNVHVRTVRIVSSTDSLLFGGYFSDVNDHQLQDVDNIPEIQYKWKTVRIEFSSSIFGYQNNLEYSYRLKGFDVGWSDWNKRTEKEYTNLPAGRYLFEVKVRNNLGNESAPTNYAFVVLPPWYQTIWAKILYFLLMAIFVYVLYKWQHKKFLLQQKKYEDEQNRLLYIHDLEITKTESEIVLLRNEKLEAEINFTNSEMASSAMHLVKKGELLTKIKTELSQVMKKLNDEVAIAELKRMIKSLSDDDKIDAEWENFTKHFDKVHSDFVVKLKDKHPAISGNELKLCTYLRMNLSTKEIAQLMNISVRGVEISRYRLRKKLGITSEMSLFDYLIHFNN